MKVYGLTGYPLEHSYSLSYFNEKFRKDNLTDCSFRNFPMQDINQLPALIESNPGLRGLAVTIPHKQSVLPFLDEISEEAAAVGAVNCIRISDGKLSGFNTDVTGFELSFKSGLRPSHQKALILGTGGSSLAVKFVLRKLGIDFLMVSRELRRDDCITYADINEAIMASHTAIINCTPLGMFPHTGTCPDIPYALITADHYLFDLVYNPEETLFLKEGRLRGAVVQNGLSMLHVQAEANWRLWN